MPTSRGPVVAQQFTHQKQSISRQAVLVSETFGALAYSHVQIDASILLSKT